MLGSQVKCGVGVDFGWVGGGVLGNVESARVRFAVLSISIRTQTPKQHKLEKRLDGRDGRRAECGSRLL